jgi:predicted MFS family arabinose efflux permease
MLKATSQTYRNAYQGLSRSTWLLSLVMLINRSGTMVVPFMMLYMLKMGYSISKSGFVVGLFGLGAFSGAWLGGRLTDKIGFYPVQLITLFGGGILFIILGQMKTYGLICLFSYLVSFVNEAFRPANSTAIAFYSKEENRTRSFALNRLAINLGWALGGFFGGFFAKISYELLFWVDGITNILAAILMWRLLKPVNYKPSPPKVEITNRQTTSAYRDKKYIFFIVMSMLFACCFFQIFTNLSAYFKKDLHLSETFYGFLMMVNGLIIAFVEMVLIYKLEGKRKYVTYISTGIALAGISFLVLNIPFTGWVIALSMIILITFGEILSMPFMNSYWISRTQSSNRGQYAALYTMSWSAAQVIGPVGGSQLAGHFGFNVLWWTIGGLCFLVSLALHKWA